MIVDCHTHVGEIKHYGQEFVGDLEAAWDDVRWEASTLEDHWEAMRYVDRAIVLAFDAPASGFVVPNEYVSEYVMAHPEKLIGFCSVDPNRRDAVERLRHAIEGLGLRGLKLGPTYQHFDPVGSVGMTIFREAERLGIPVLCHQGTTFVRSAPLEWAQPITLDSVARQCPDLKIVIAHLGHPWCEEAMAVIRKHPNLFADISALHTRPFQMYRALVAAYEYRVLDRLLFGSDFPFGAPDTTLAALRQVNEVAEGTSLPRIPEADLEAIAERDSLQLLGLEP